MPKQTSDITNDPYGITYPAAGQTWQVVKGVSVYGNEVGVYSEYADSTLKNKGSITGNGAGVVFDGKLGTGTYVVKNGGKASIHGAEAGVVIVDFAGSAVLNNKGSVSGVMFGALLENVSTSVKVQNKGSISGSFYGLGIGVDSAGGSGPKIDNHGKIEGGIIGILIDGALDFAADLHNHKGGVIHSLGAAVVSAGQLEFHNEGKVKGSVITGDLGDTIVNKGKIKGDVALGDGADVFKNKGKATSGMIDTGDGNDRVVLGKKADILLFNSALDAMTNVDTVKKFESGEDKIYLNLNIFTELTAGTLSASQFHKGTSAADADDRIIYDKKSGALYYDPDGSGGAAQIQFADLGAGTKLKASDFKAGYDMVDYPLIS